MVNLGLKEMITNKNGGQGPETKISNTKGQEINDIWASKGMIISHRG